MIFWKKLATVEAGDGRRQRRVESTSLKISTAASGKMKMKNPRQE